MKKNMGTFDRASRALFAAAIAILYFTDALAGTAALILGTFAVVFLVTSLLGFCPLYAPFKFATKKTIEVKK